MPGLGRRIAVATTLAVGLAVASSAVPAPGSPLVASCAAAGPNHAALVVEHGSGSVVTRCVAFDAASVTGEQLLDSSGVAWSGQTFGGFGEAVCAMDEEPAQYVSCPGKDGYWAVFVATGGGEWQLSPVGISSLKLGDGDAEGFRYVPASGDPAPPQPAAGVCGGAAASSPVRAGAAALTAPTAPTAPAPSTPRSPAQSGGIDAALLAAALAAVVLAGLAVVRLSAARRRAP
jgi:hypothetical protein